jgi:hypothetical protein
MDRTSNTEIYKTMILAVEEDAMTIGRHRGRL